MKKSIWKRNLKGWVEDLSYSLLLGAFVVLLLAGMLYAFSNL